MPLGSHLLVLLCLSGLSSAWKTFIVPHDSSNRSADDAPLLVNALASDSLTSNVTILFQKGITYNIFSPVKFPAFQNVEVAIEGNLSYPADVSVVQGTYHSLLTNFASTFPSL